MKPSLCLLAIGAPLLLGAALPHNRPIPHVRPSDVVEANFLTRLLEGTDKRRQSSSAHRRTRSSQGRSTTPEPPALADVPLPLARPAGPEDAAAPSERPVEPAGRQQAKSQETTQPEAKAEEPPTNEYQANERPAADGQESDRNTTLAQANPPAVSEVPTPQPKPGEGPSSDQPATATTDTGPKPDGKEEEEEEKAEAPPPPPIVRENPEELKACLAELTSLGTKFDPTDPIDEGDGCGIESPIDVAEVLPGVDLGGATMRCKTALSMAHWLKDTVQPAMNIAMPGRKIIGIVPGSTYACRLRNGASTGKISEHARGNAFDVAAFKLDNGKTMEMKPREEDSTLEGAFQRTATAGACLHFTTVLSPGSDAAHETHLHLDVMERKNGYRYCR